MGHMILSVTDLIFMQTGWVRHNCVHFGELISSLASKNRTENTKSRVPVFDRVSPDRFLTFFFA